MTNTIQPGETLDSKEELERQIIERVSLVKNSLLSSHYQNRWIVVGIKQIINRFFMLLQKRRVIVILEKNDMDDYKIIHHSCLDPFWKDDFENNLQNELYGKFISKNDKSNHDLIVIESKRLADPKINKKHFSIESYLIEFYPKRYFMIHEMYSSKDKNQDVRELRKFRPIEISNDKFLSHLADAFKKSLNTRHMQKFFDNVFDNENIREKVLHKENEWKNKKIKRALPTQSSEFWGDIPEIISYETQKEMIIYDEIKHIFDREYKKIQDSPLLTDTKSPANIFFFIRDFSRKKARFYGNYHHNVRLIIPESQKKDLINGFKKLKKDFLVSNEKSNFSKNKEITIDDDFFWNLIEKDTFDEIIDILESPYEDYARSMSDTIFETGYVNIKESPFYFRGSNRLETIELEKKSKSHGYKRLVCFHYLLSMLAPKDQDVVIDEENNLSALLVPGFIGGSPFFCMGFVFHNETLDKHQRWLNNYHFYHSVCHYIVRGVRSKIRDLYLETIRNVYITEQDSIISDIVQSLPFLPRKVCDTLNPIFRALTRIFPFEYIELNVVPGNKKENYQAGEEEEIIFFHRYLRVQCLFAIKIHDNPFFIRELEGKFFLENEKIEKVLSEADEFLRLKTQRLRTQYKKSRLSVSDIHLTKTIKKK